VNRLSILRLTSVLVAVISARGLWGYWGGMCNEGCASSRALEMQILSIVIPAAFVTLFITCTSPRTNAFQRFIVAAVFVSLLLWGLTISLA
jgi:hypothetical protein